MWTLNKDIDIDGKIELQNGATRTTLLVLNKSGQKITANRPFEAEVGFLDKGNHRFFFINKPHRCCTGHKYIFVDAGYGVDILNKPPIKKASSIGGYGNSESTVAVLEEGTILYCHSYKDRQTGTYYKCHDGSIDLLPPEDAAMIMAPEEVETV